MGLGIMHEQLQLSGRYRVRESDTGLILAESPNMIHTAGLGLVGDMLRDGSGFDTGLTYLGLSTNSTAPVVGDSTLAGEVSRKAFSGRTRSGNEVTFSAFFTAAQSTYNITKLGVFGHSTATDTLGTGVLFSSALVSYDNSSGAVDLVIEYVLTLAEV